MKKSARLFKTGGSLAVRIPKEWVPRSHRVTLRKEGRSIIISEEREDLLDLARRFARDGGIDFNRPPQPRTPKSTSL